MRGTYPIPSRLNQLPPHLTSPHRSLIIPHRSARHPNHSAATAQQYLLHARPQLPIRQSSDLIRTYLCEPKADRPSPLDFRLGFGFGFWIGFTQAVRYCLSAICRPNSQLASLRLCTQPRIYETFRVCTQVIYVPCEMRYAGSKQVH